MRTILNAVTFLLCIASKVVFDMSFTKGIHLGSGIGCSSKKINAFIMDRF